MMCGRFSAIPNRPPVTRHPLGLTPFQCAARGLRAARATRRARCRDRGCTLKE